MPKLDQRLQAVLELINTDYHADIGSDHAGLPIKLIQSGRARRCVIVELNKGPLEKSRLAVAKCRLTDKIDVRQGNGLEPLQEQEVNSISITGMGAGTITGILERSSSKLPHSIFVQPNDSPMTLRRWALNNSFHVAQEKLIKGYWNYQVIHFMRLEGTDPAYANIDLEAALRYGALLLKEKNVLLKEQVQSDIARLGPLAAPNRRADRELGCALSALKILSNA